MSNFYFTKRRMALFLFAIPAFATAQNTDSTKTLEDVVVTGQYTPQSLKSSVYKVRVISKELIKQKGATDVMSVLNTQAGIRFSLDPAQGETDINLMGVSGRGIKILIDGVPMIDRNDARQSLSQVDINTVERIEIVEGPMSTLYGSDAIAGVINIITKKAKNTAGLSVTARVQEESTGEYYSPFTDDGTHIQNIGLNWNKGKWNAGGSYTRNTFGGWIGNAANLRENEWKPKDQDIVGGTVGYHTNNFNAWYRLDYLHENIYAPGAVLASYKSIDNNYITNRYTHQLQAEWSVSSKFKLNNALSYQDYDRDSKTTTIDYTTQSQSVTGLSNSTFKTAFFRTTAQWFASSKFSLQPGIEIRSDKVTGDRVEPNDGIVDYSLFASAEYRPIDRLKIRPGVRFTHNSVYDAPPAIPSLNIKYELNNRLDFRASYGRGFRAPQLRELYFLFVDASHNIYGNPDLKAETSNSFNASLHWNVPVNMKVELHSTLSGFYNDIFNKIDFALSGSNYTYMNIAKYKTAGFTLENRLAWKALDANVSFSYIGRYNDLFGDATFGKEVTEFSWSPEASANVVYTFKKLKATAGLFYKFTGSLPGYETELNTTTGKDEVHLTRIESWHLADLTASKSLFKYLTLQAGIKNIFDVKRLQNTSESSSIHSSAGAISTAYGRSYFVGLNFQWNKK